MTLTRRDLLKNGALLVAFGLTAPSFLTQAALATQASPMPKSSPLQTTAGAGSRTRARLNGKQTLVVVQLSGGNDGLNTVVPYADPGYYALRPTLAVPRDQVVPLDGRVGFHPSLSPLKSYFDNGTLAVVQGVGYPNPNRSHFRSMEIWHTATPERFEESGWLGRYMDACGCGHDRPLDAINVGDTLNRSFWTDMTLVPAIGSIGTFQFQTDPGNPRDRGNQVKALQNIYAYAGQFRPYEEHIRRTTLNALAGSDELKRIATAYQPSIEYPQTPFGTSLKAVSQVIAGDLGTRIFFVQLGGFDTHANQANTHAGLLATLATGLDAFMRDMESQGKADDVLVMTFSEFGRRAAQNASGGTDHGTAEPMLLLGGGIAGGLHNAPPSLSELPEGDLAYQADFRGVYASILQDWLGTDPAPIVGAGIQPLALMA